MELSIARCSTALVAHILRAPLRVCTTLRHPWLRVLCFYGGSSRSRSLQRRWPIIVRCSHRDLLLAGERSLIALPNNEMTIHSHPARSQARLDLSDLSARLPTTDFRFSFFRCENRRPLRDSEPGDRDETALRLVVRAARAPLRLLRRPPERPRDPRAAQPSRAAHWSAAPRPPSSALPLAAPTPSATTASAPATRASRVTPSKAARQSPAAPLPATATPPASPTSVSATQGTRAIPSRRAPWRRSSAPEAAARTPSACPPA